MLDRGLASLGLTLSQNKFVVASHLPIAACRSARAAEAGDILRRSRFRPRRGPRCQCRAQEISQNSNQEGAEMSQKKRPHQSHTEWVETQASDNEVVQNWGCRCVWKEERDRVHNYNPTQSFWREWGPSQLFGFRWIIEPGSSSKERKWGTDRKGLTLPVRGLPLLPRPNDRDNGDFARPQHHPCFPVEMVPPLKIQMSIGPTLVVILALSSVKCNRDSPTRPGNRRHCIPMVSVRKMV